MSLTDILHDEIDAQESFRERANEIVKNVAKENLPKILAQTTDVKEILTAITILIENQMAGLTTEAVRTGAELAISRAKSLG